MTSSLTARQPLVSIVIPAYRSERTIARTLAALEKQSFSDFETVVVDSSPTGATTREVSRYPWVRLLRTRRRLLPHDARDLAVSVSRGRIIVTTDPDAFPEPGWLMSLLQTFEKTGEPVTGAILCEGNRSLHHGIHLHKFGRWSARRPPGSIELGPTVNLLVSREQLDRVGGFQAGGMLGDTVLSWKLRESGYVLRFDPGAVVHHAHTGTFQGYLRERFRRGREFSGIRAERYGWSRLRMAFWLLISVLPVRLLFALRRLVILFQAQPKRGHFWNARVLLVSFCGTGAHVAGEVAGLVDKLGGNRARNSDT